MTLDASLPILHSSPETSIAGIAFELPRMARIAEIIRETPLVKTFVLDTDIDAQPGQFVMLWLPGVDEKPMSIAGMRPLSVSAARVGPMTSALHALAAGDRVGWRGPFGRPFRLERERTALMVAGGYGSAPLYVLAKQALAYGMDVSVAIGARAADELLYADKFGQLLGGTRGALLLSTNDGSRGVQGFVTEAIADSPISARDALTVYACGPEPMLVALHRLCCARGWNGQLSVERYMKCGFGVCGQCALDDLLVCIDGPVMSLHQLEGKGDFGRWHRGPTGRKFEI
jgi:dihydroorotate dehydrogenase electron transfer subunit